MVGTWIVMAMGLGVNRQRGGSMGKVTDRIKRFRYGEALLWLGFVLSAATSVDGKGDVILAGIFVLAAIGVRATRPDPSQ
jgi:hypothetical protein